jgi:type IV secretion system protein VirD4
MTYALGYGVRYWFFVQELAQLMALYPTKWKALFNSTDVRMLMDVEEVELLELVSKSFLGTKTEAVETVSVSDAFGSQTNDHLGRSAGSGGGANYGVNLQSRPLLFPDELKHYLTAKINPGHPLGAHGLVLCRGHRPFTVHRPYWFDFSWDSAQVEAGKAHLGGLEEGMMDLKAF